MCDQPKCNWLKHLLGKCDHYKKVDELQSNIIKTREETNKELKQFNKRLNVLIKDENIRITLTNIRKVAK